MIEVMGKRGTHILMYGSESIPFKVEFRQHKRLSISVCPNGSVAVIAPLGTDLNRVYRRVQKRAHWIAKQRAHFEVFRPLPLQMRYVSGETHWYLGRQYRLKIEHFVGEESAKLKGKYLHIQTADPKEGRCIEKLINNWYTAHARDIFDARLDWCLKNAVSLDLLRPTILIKKMTRRWGSCSQKGAISLNLDLVKTPLYCIEYVIMHELCHLRIHNHSAAYFRLLARCMPDWEKRKARLDTFVI